MWVIRSLLAAITLCFTTTFAEEYSLETKVILDGEIARHVIDECDLQIVFGKNRIDFDPVDVAVNILPEIHKTMWKEKNNFRNDIRSVVYHFKSFALRARMYDAYYALCIGEISQDEAEREIVRSVQVPLTESDKEDDLIIFNLYDPGTNDEHKVRRDASRIKILKRMNEAENRAHIKKKNLSVIQEYLYDIELWECCND